MSITILELAEHRLGHKARTSADFEAAQLPICGGCERCGASIAAYNAHPSHSGYLRCGSCIAEVGFQTVEQGCAAIFDVSEDCVATAC